MLAYANTSRTIRMLLVTMKIDGMACTMCESHIKDKIRISYPGAKSRSERVAKYN